ncbi:type II/III secretion system protein [Desulfoplanes formicivorans]|uniref:Type II/III secretion system protein n=2 Tax=Desulfoplanes formicivorans TaxID=1592317 RepID=A0A194AIB1_9BACT|nr:type II/III secretion system protein [Desulfoplanes formicivorans]
MIAVTMLLVGTGCLDKKPTTDPFMEKWKKMAQESRGYSPELTQEKIDVDQPDPVLEVFSGEEKPVSVRPLPTMPTTLDVHDTEIRAVLQALAKAARQNILINTNIKGTATVRFHKTPWDEAFNALLKSHALTYEWEGDIIRVMSIEDMKKQLEIEALRAKSTSQDMAIKKLAPLKTRVIKVKYANIWDIQGSLISALGGESKKSGSITEDASGAAASNVSVSTEQKTDRGNVFVDVHSNSLILQARSEDMEMLTNLIAILDRPPKQIHLKAYIVEATKTTGRELGMQWGGKWSNNLSGSSDSATIGSAKGGEDGATALFGDGKSGQGMISNFPFGSIAAPGMGTNGLGLNFMLGNSASDILEAQLTALETKGEINILSSPSITTMDNLMAFTESGAKVPYVSYDDGDKTVEFEDAVLRLEITPHVIDSTYLKMKILVKKDEVDFSEATKVEGNPTIVKKQTSTNLIVRNNETIVISGLTKQTLSDATSQVPGLGDVPGLGWLFKGNSKSDEMEEILIFVTPTILDTHTEAFRKPPLAVHDATLGQQVAQ